MILGFAGKAASGKTTAAKYLLEKLSEQIVILPMAQVLREEVEDFIRQVGAEKNVPLIYGDQDDKVRVFYIATDRARQLCSDWDDYLSVNQEIQDKPGFSAVTVRRILQWWGTELRRNQDADYWTKAWERKLLELDLNRTNVLVDDVRFINELEVIRRNGGHFIRIIRPGFDGANNHSSENSLDGYSDWDLVVDNNGDLDQFIADIEAQVLPLLLAGR